MAILTLVNRLGKILLAVLLLGLPSLPTALALAGPPAEATTDDTQPAGNGRLVGLPQPVVGEPVFDLSAERADPFAGQEPAADPFAPPLAASAKGWGSSNPSATIFGED